MMRGAIICISIAIAAALAFGLPDDPNLTLPDGATPIRTTSILLIKAPQARSSLSDIRRPRLRMIMIIRRRISLANSSLPHHSIGALERAKYGSFEKRHSIWNRDKLLSHSPDLQYRRPKYSISHNAHNFKDHSALKKAPELKYVHSAERYSDKSNIDRYASFKNKPHGPEHNTSEDPKPHILRRETIIISMFVVATLCGLGLVILMMRPRNTVVGDTNEEVDNKTYAPLLTPSVVTTTV